MRKTTMAPASDLHPISAHFVTTHFVDEQYHEQHSQLVHSHADELELLYIMRGTGRYIVSGKEYPIGAGNLIICNAGAIHGEPSMQSHSLKSYCCVLNRLSLPGLPENNLIENSRNPVLFFSEDRDAVEHIFLALDELDQKDKALGSVCDLLANALLNLVYAKLRRRRETNERLHENNEEFIQHITRYLDEHYREPLTLQELGKQFFISQHYLSHIFKDETGLSPMKYVLYRKIGESQNLLMNTPLSIGEISHQLGFNDNCHFSTTFKKYIGLTPTQYRNHFRGSVGEELSGKEK